MSPVRRPSPEGGRSPTLASHLRREATPSQPSQVERGGRPRAPPRQARPRWPCRHTPAADRSDVPASKASSRPARSAWPAPLHALAAPPVARSEVWERHVREASLLRRDAAERHHGQAAVLDLGKLQALHLLRGLAEPTRQRKVPGLAVALQRLHDAGIASDLADHAAEEQDEHVARRDGGVVHFEGGEPIESRLARDARRPQALIDRDPADDAEHAHAAVLDLSLAHPRKRPERVGQAEGVEAHVAGHAAVQVLRAVQEGQSQGLLPHGDASRARGTQHRRGGAGERERGGGESKHCDLD
mmetsp:Transcript_16500/g.28119  ORF Transcript_16500/g.28119 Transcript_16500/m.28119 type:complete len:301 (-) Transcript_16500:3-905(-)